MATIYVNPTVSGIGTGTIGDPYKSWASVTWVAGNVYLQAADTTYSGTILVNVTGTQANPIIVGSYDPATGARTTGGIKRARINGNNTRLTVRTAGAVHWVTFDNLEIFGTTGVAGQNGIAIYLGSSESSVSDDCMVSNCWIHDVTGAFAPSVDSDGIMFFGSRNRIINNLIENISADGIWGQGNASYIVGNTVRNVSTENTRGDCVQLYGTTTLRNDGAYIARNYLDHGNKESKQCIISGDATYSSGSVIEFNTCRMAPYAGVIQTTCIMAEGPNSIVRGNVCFGGFMGIYLTTSNGRATGNVVVGNTIGIQQAPAGASGALVANNVCANSTYLGIQADSDASFRAYNNILIGCVNGIGLAGVEDFNAFWQCRANKIARVGSPTFGANTFTMDVTRYLNDDYSLPALISVGGIPMPNPLRNAGTYVQGVTLRNGRTQPGMTPIGAYQVGRY